MLVSKWQESMSDYAILEKKFKRLWNHTKLKLMEKHTKLKVFEILMDTRLADTTFMLVKLSLSLKEDLQLEWRKESNTLSKLLGRLVKGLCLKALIVHII